MADLNVSPTLRINEQVKSMWEDGKDVLHLGFGESRFPVHPEMKNALMNGMLNRSYLPPSGTEKLREKIAGYYSKKLGLNFSPEQVIVGIGSKSLLFAMIYLTDGDLLLPKPSWVSYSAIAKLSGKAVTRFDLDRSCEFRLNIDTLNTAYDSAKRKGQNPTMIVLNTPNNPVGNSFSQADIEAVATWAKENNILILSDEIYSLVTFKETTHTTPASYFPDKTIIFGGLSKHLSLGGWRLGISILPNNKIGNQLKSGFDSVAGSIWSCVPAPFQVAGETAFSHNQDIEAYIQLCTEIHSIRTRYAYDSLKKKGLECPKPTGAFYIYPSFKKWSEQLNALGILSCSSLADHLLNEYEIATLPGIAFGDDPENLCIRLSTSYLDMETDERAQHILDIFNSDIDPKTFMKDHHPRMNHFLSRMDDFLSTLN